MTARVLVVDDVAANVKLLEARLTAEYFEVVTATSGAEALDICSRGLCDIVLLDVMMPGMDGLEVCRRIKADPRTAHIPVVMVTALDQPADRVSGLEAGADDFIAKPVDDMALATRVKSLARLKTLTDELMMRAATSTEIGFDEAMDPRTISGEGGRILLVEDMEASVDRIVRTLSPLHTVDVNADPQEALFAAAENDYDLVVVSLSLSGIDGLRLCSQLRSLDRTRQIPILVIVDPDDRQRLLRGLDIGVNDYLLRPIDRNELLARVRTQIKRKRFSDRLRDNVQMTLEMAVTDGLTGLHNRRYLERHLTSLVRQAQDRGKPLSLLVLDIDHFKMVNDVHGHLVGDDVLREFSRRVRKAVRGIDLVCRLGGEEFIVAMPDTTSALAVLVGERIRQKIAGEPFQVTNGSSLEITVSIGVSSLESASDTPEALMKRADEALYGAKRGGRNRVSAAA
ncbi:MAG: PleD family two-component system response regulator [Bauldia sp.]|uniref:PleD family two-component system response regulator n=1 Tax=Bauldia sp. TaxID=2575872 RepID=UPI001D868AE3|nr:PleD family two-component system response regulator [Bauldia sp.]MCB1496712.1 PleD family two-component system response regulator [Bauldia sp.]